GARKSPFFSLGPVGRVRENTRRVRQCRRGAHPRESAGADSGDPSARLGSMPTRPTWCILEHHGSHLGPARPTPVPPEPLALIRFLRQPLAPFGLAIAAGLVAGLVGTRSGSVLAFAVTVLLAALVVAVLDLVANLSAEWHGLPTDAERRSSLVGTAWELLTANVV